MKVAHNLTNYMFHTPYIFSLQKHEQSQNLETNPKLVSEWAPFATLARQKHKQTNPKHKQKATYRHLTMVSGKISTEKKAAEKMAGKKRPMEKMGNEKN